MLMLALPALALETRERALALNGKINSDGSKVEFSWPRANGTRVGRVTIERRQLGESGKDSWQAIDTVRGFARLYEDATVQPGIAYEYRISRPSKEVTETSYWATGVQVPAQEQRGVALVVVDETIAAELAPRLERFMLDLAGDGWKVVRHDAERANYKDKVTNLRAARKLRAWIQAEYNKAHYLPHALILVGGLPAVKSGKAQPDGHQVRPLDTDLFYADTNAVWKDDGKGFLLHTTIPSDHIEMQVGRIDFSRLDDSLGDELSLLRRYFDKNHHWRHGRLGDLRQAYGTSTHLFVELNALRNIVGPENFVKGEHHDAGIEQPWLFGVDFGSSKYKNYLTADPIQAVFSINFGSGKLDFTLGNNEMKAMLMQSWYGLTTGWGARPAWQLHPMALGKSIGYSHLRTVNNGTYTRGGQATLEYTMTGNYFWVNPVWANLLGDPTLRPFPLPSVSSLSASRTAEGILLEWSAGAADAEYRIYRSTSRLGPYQPLNPSALQGETRFIDTDPQAGGWYMVRAHALKQVHAGSFYRYAQGSFATADNHPPMATSQTISVAARKTVTLPFAAVDRDADKRLTIAPIRPPEAGRLLATEAGWTFLPEAGFSGPVTIPFSVFDGVSSDQGLITIEVQP